MKTYEQTVKKIAQDAFNNLLSGGWGLVEGVSLVAWIFDTPPSKVHKDLDGIRSQLWKENGKKKGV